MTEGFKSQRKTPKCFEKHWQSKFHKITTVYHVVIPKRKDTIELTRENLSADRAKERSYLPEIIQSLRYLGEQGITLQGHKGEDNFTQLIVFLRTKDENIRDHLNNSLGHKYSSHDIQNEILDVMAFHVLREKIKEIRENVFFFLQWAPSIRIQ